MSGKLHSALKFFIRLVFALMLVISILFFVSRACTRGYDQYAFYIHVNEESIFQDPISPTDSRLIDKGRKPKPEVTTMDNEIDNGDGPKAGKLRWYGCTGIDCDEGWEKEFTD